MYWYMCLYNQSFMPVIETFLPIDFYEFFTALKLAILVCYLGIWKNKISEFSLVIIILTWSL